MKYLSFLLALILTTSTLAAPPLGVSGSADTVNKYPSVIKVPNKLATDIGSGQSLLESGNTNLLQNPSFEHSTFNTGWTCTGVTPILETTYLAPGAGKKGMVLAGAGGSYECYQDSTLGTTSAQGVQLLASIMTSVSSNLTGTVKVCARQNGVTSTTLCATPSKDGIYKLAKVPFLGNSSSNGIAIVGTAVTGNVYVDHAFVGAVDLKQEGDSSRFVGSLKYTGATNCAWISSTTSFVNNTADTDCATPLVTGSIQAPSTKVPAFILPGSLGAGDYEVTVNGLLYSSATGTVCGWRISDGTISSDVSSTYAAGTGAAGGGGAQVFRLAVTGSSDRTFHLQTNASGASCVIDAGVANRQELSFQIKKLASSSTYSSTNADTDWAACSFSTLAWQGLGTVTSNLECKRDGGDILMRGRVVIGTVSASEAIIPLPVWNGAQLASASSSRISSTQTTGKLHRAAASAVHSPLMSASLTYLQIGSFTSPANVLTPLLGSSYNSSEILVMDNIRIPIEGWENSNVIIGQFNGLESCTDSYQCTDTFSAKVSATDVVTEENLDFVSGDCTNATAGQATCTFRSGLFTVAPNCTTTSTLNRSCYITSTSATSIAVACADLAGTATNAAFNLSCQKQGADYIGKTAKAVASDQNVRTPGVTKAVVVSAHVAANGTVSREFGDFINGNCTNANPRVCTYSTNFWAEIPNCYMQTETGGASSTNNTAHVETFSLTSLTFRTMNGTTGAAMGTFVTCHGYTL